MFTSTIFIIIIICVIVLISDTATFESSFPDDSSQMDVSSFKDPFDLHIAEENVLKQYKCNYTGVVYFLHPSGMNATWMRKYLQYHQADLNFRHLKLVFPDAPLIRYTPLDAMKCHAWIDRQDRTNLGTEDEDTVENSCRQLKKMIDKEVRSGTPMNRIIIGGLQTGGEMALHAAYRCLPDIAGVFALSTFLRQDSRIYQHLERNKTSRRPPLLKAFWVRDQVIPPLYSQQTFDKLISLGVPGESLLLQPLEYIMSSKELTYVWKWICKLLPNADKNVGFELDFYFDASPGTGEVTSNEDGSF
ncbi:lysophospholipase-like protein 1 [Planococcus citri]|uniref:lysophospholipase-like protein 1 n=1 Tax=Planococcus citri TaxID=170843 RepID=UPI0031F9DF3B